MDFSYVLERHVHDAGDVVVGERVFDGAGAALPDDEPGRAQHAQVLRHQWLRDAERADRLVDFVVDTVQVTRG